jgi:hypothetical protein
MGIKAEIRCVAVSSAESRLAFFPIRKGDAGLLMRDPAVQTSSGAARLFGTVKKGVSPR